MGFDGNGNWTSPFYPIQDRDNGIAILASKFQTLIQTNLKESFENCITRDGAGKPTTNINWNGNKITNLQNGTSSADAVNKSQLDTKVSKSGDTMIGDLTVSKSDASLKLVNDNSVEYDITANDNGNLELVPVAGRGKKVYLNATDNYKPYYTNGTYNYKILNSNDLNNGNVVGFPDLTAGVSITSGHVTTHNGWIYIFGVSIGIYPSYNPVDLYYDSVLVWSSATSARDGRDALGQFGIMLPVKAGVTVTNDKATTFQFFPNL